MADPKKKCPACPPEGAPAWMNTYSDMVTLLLCFFVLLYNVAEVQTVKLQGIVDSFNGMGNLQGGKTLQEGQLAELGNTVEGLPSMRRAKTLNQARRKAITEFQPEVRTNKVRVQEDERGLVISLAADAYFRSASAEINMDQARDVLVKLTDLLTSPQMAGKKFRIEGHTDGSPTDPSGPWRSNWELSATRAVNVLHRLAEYGVNENQFQVAGFGSTVPLVKEDTPEAMAYNRRVDIIVLSAGHL